MTDDQYTAHVPTDAIPNEEAYWRTLELRTESEILRKSARMQVQNRLAQRIAQHPRYGS